MSSTAAETDRVLETALGQLTDAAAIIKANRTPAYWGVFDDLYNRVHAAILALTSGQQDRRWGESGNDVRSEPNGVVVATCKSPEMARRIADEHNRLIVLERAARGVVLQATGIGFAYQSKQAEESMARLAAALDGVQP